MQLFDIFDFKKKYFKNVVFFFGQTSKLALTLFDIFDFKKKYFKNIIYFFRQTSKLALTWFVNTNEDVGDFRLELASLKGDKPRTLLVKDIGYNTR